MAAEVTEKMAGRDLHVVGLSAARRPAKQAFKPGSLNACSKNQPKSTACLFHALCFDISGYFEVFHSWCQLIRAIPRPGNAAAMIGLHAQKGKQAHETGAH